MSNPLLASLTIRKRALPSAAIRVLSSRFSRPLPQRVSSWASMPIPTMLARRHLEAGFLADADARGDLAVDKERHVAAAAQVAIVAVDFQPAATAHRLLVAEQAFGGDRPGLLGGNRGTAGQEEKDRYGVHRAHEGSPSKGSLRLAQFRWSAERRGGVG